MIIRGGAGGDNISSPREAGASITGGCGSTDVGSVLAGTDLGETMVLAGTGSRGTTSWHLSKGR